MAHTTDQANRLSKQIDRGAEADVDGALSRLSNPAHALDSLTRSAQDSNVHVATCTCGRSAERYSRADAQQWWYAHEERQHELAVHAAHAELVYDCEECRASGQPGSVTLQLEEAVLDGLAPHSAAYEQQRQRIVALKEQVASEQAEPETDRQQLADGAKEAALLPNGSVPIGGGAPEPGELGDGDDAPVPCRWMLWPLAQPGVTCGEPRAAGRGRYCARHADETDALSDRNGWPRFVPIAGGATVVRPDVECEICANGGGERIGEDADGCSIYAEATASIMVHEVKASYYECREVGACVECREYLGAVIWPDEPCGCEPSSPVIVVQAREEWLRYKAGAASRPVDSLSVTGWPLSVESVQLWSRDGSVWIEHQGKVYPVNGNAEMHLPRRGAKVSDLRDVWTVAERIGPGVFVPTVRKDLWPLIKLGMELGEEARP